MAFTSFHLIAGGVGSADINAGSSIGAAQTTTTNGNWDAATGIFVASAGTPFAATIVGDYASVYVDGATVTTFVGRVTLVTSSTQITVDITTIKYGTAPSTSATARSCTINGSWATEQVLAAGGLATTTVPQSTKINIKGNLAVGAARVISMAGATTTPLWFSGYNTTPGDLDADTTNSLAKPVWTFGATFLFTTSGAFQLWSGLSVIGNRSGTQWNATGSPQNMSRCRVENASTNAAAIAITCAQAGGTVSYSYFKTPATATTTGVVSVTGTSITFLGCVVDTGGLAGFNTGAVNNFFIDCIGLNNVGSFLLASTARPVVIGCTIYNSTVDGVKWSGTPTAGSIVARCLFVSGSNTMTNGINNASGTTTANVFRANNDYFNVTNPEVGFGDMPAFFGQTESVSPVTSATDLSLVSGANARNHGFPGVFENEIFSSFADIGAAQVQASSSGSGGVGGQRVSIGLPGAVFG